MKNIIFLLMLPFLGCNKSYREADFILNPITRITDEKAITSFCSVSKDGKYITFSTNKMGNFNLYIKNVEEKAITQLTFGKADDLFPQFSPCGKKIVFSSNRYGSFDIFIIDAEKRQEIRQITFFDDKDELFPSFSSDGNKIVFTLLSKRGFSPIIMVIDLQTGLSTEITHGFYGRFSEDGNTILFNRANKDDIDIWMVDINGKNERLIFHNEKFNCLFPSFSPSYSNIVYVASPKGKIKEFRFDKKIDGLKMDIRCIDIKGRNDRRITGPSGIDTFPCWVGNFIYFSSQRGDVVDIFRVQAEEILEEKIEATVIQEERRFPEPKKGATIIQEERFRAPQEREPKEKVITTKDNVAIWSYPGKSVITNIDKGTKLIVIDASKKWYIKVLLPDGREGWVCAFFVE